MPFTPSERERFVGRLQSRGWTLEKDTLWSPSRGLYFNDSHFRDWSPAEMRDVFTRRGDRIQKSAFDGWERSVGEHRDVCSAVAEVLSA